MQQDSDVPIALSNVHSYFVKRSMSESILVLRSEIPIGMCAKLRTVAAKNNRDHARNLSYYCLLALHI